MESHQISSVPKPKPKNTVLYVVLGLLACLALCCGGLGVVIFYYANRNRTQLGCIMQYQQAYQAVNLYSKDHNGNLPPEKNWQDAIIPYILNKDNAGQGFLSFGDPKGDLGCKGENGEPSTGMTYNSTVAGKNLRKLLDKQDSILLYETLKTGRNLSQPYKPPTGLSPQKLFGEYREWITVDLYGSAHTGGLPSKVNGDAN